MLRRLGGIAALVVAIFVPVTGGQAVASGYDSRVSMRAYQVVPYTGLQISAEFHTPKVAFGDWIAVKVDLSSLDDRVRVEPVGGSCERVDAQHFACETGHSDDRQADNINFNLSAPADMPPGPAGVISIWLDGRDQDPNPANNTVRSTLDITNRDGSRVEVDTAPVQAQVGQTVTVPVTGRNKGPNAIWAFAVGNVSIGENLAFVDYTGCVDAHTPIFCASGHVRVGASATIGLKIKVLGCGSGRGTLPVEYRNGFDSKETIIDWRFAFTVAIAGCPPAPSEPGQSTGRDDGPGADSQAQPLASAMVTPPPPSAGSADIRAAEDTRAGAIAAVPAGHQGPARQPGIGGTGLMLLAAMAAAAAGHGWRRRHRRARTAHNAR